MKKETSIAIGMGIVFGLVFSFIVILNTQKNSSVSQKKSPAKVREVSTTEEQQVITAPITISSPSDGAIIGASTVTIKGKVEKDSFVVIQTPSKDAVLTATNEDFSYNLPLALGENIVHVSAYPKGGLGKVQEKEFKVYYLNTK